MSAVITDTPSKVSAELVNQVNNLVTDITALRTSYNALLADVTAIRTAASGHTHAGVTVGAGSATAVAAIAALTATTASALTVTAVTLTK